MIAFDIGVSSLALHKGRAGISSLKPHLWLDPSDISTLFQDAAGTIPVSAPGQPVGRIADKSGHGHHATQPSNNAYRPTLQEDENGQRYLSFDGSGDHLIVNFPQAISQPSTQAIAFTKGAKQSWYLTDGLSSSSRNSLRRDGTVLRQFGGLDAVLGDAEDNVPNVAIATFDAAASATQLNDTTFGPHNSGAHAVDGLTIGSRFNNVVHFDGRLHQMVFIARALTQTEMARVRRHLDVAR